MFVTTGFWAPNESSLNIDKLKNASEKYNILNLELLQNTLYFA